MIHDEGSEAKPGYRSRVPVTRGDFDCGGDFNDLIKLIISVPNLCSQLLRLSFIYPSMSL